MVKDHRVTLTRRHAYRTKSNRVKTIKTPGMTIYCDYNTADLNKFVTVKVSEATSYLFPLVFILLCRRKICCSIYF